MPKITELDAEQAAALSRFRAEWFAWGTCTERADRAKAEAAILKMRERIGVTKKPIFIWCASPAGIALATHFLKSEHFRGWHKKMRASLRDDSLGTSLRASLLDSLRTSLRDNSLRANSLGDNSLQDSLRASLLDSLRTSLWANLRASLGASLWDSLLDSLGTSLQDRLWASLGDNSLQDSLWDGLRTSLRTSLRASLLDSLGDNSLQDSLGDDSLGASLQDSLADQWWGQHDSHWIAVYLFCRDVLSVRYDPTRSADLNLWRDIAQSCCWWACYENYVLVSERPTVCKLDDRGVLHCEAGAALAFADGWSVHAWHGTRVPAEWIENKPALTASVALGQRNTELRRAACEIVGWARILSELNARTIDKDLDPQIGELLEVDLPDAPRERFLRVQCGTGRTFAIPVPPTIGTALQANAWTYDIPSNLLKLKEHRT